MNNVEYFENRKKWLASTRITDGKVTRTQYRGFWDTKEEAQVAPAPILWKGVRE